jgi:hypothetical protein
MNIKFRMPKFQRMTTKGGVLREMTMTVIATTISIILTFGTAMWLEGRQKVKNGRQMAMMVIHDMDVNIQAFKDAARNEIAKGEFLSYMIAHADQVDTIAVDSLIKFWTFIATRESGIIEDSKEKIFNSSPETWKNIDNPTFIDIVQDFYVKRRVYYSYLEKDRAFIQPISEDELYQVMLNADDFFVPYDRAAVKQLLRDKRVALYTACWHGRQQFLDDAAADWQRMSDQCKFVMGITDAELEEYIKKQTRTGEPVRDRQLIGRWKGTSARGDNAEVFVFNKDHTFRHENVNSINNAFYTGRLIYKSCLTGRWHIVGDSLIREYDKDRHYDIDTTEMSCSEEMKDSVAHYLKTVREYVARYNEEAKDMDLGRSAKKVSIDKSGNKIEIDYRTSDGQDNDGVPYQYLNRVKQ